MKKKRLFFLRATAVMVLALVALLDAAFLIRRDRAFSPLENRNLQQRPALTARDLLSGRFESRFDRYVSDQFPLRDDWVALKSTLDRLAGQTKSNGVFLGGDGCLIQDFKAPPEADYRRTADALTAFLDRHEDLAEYVMVAPTAVTVLADKLPALADAGDEGGYIDRLEEDLSETPATFVDLRPVFFEARGDTQLYYRTDHHWTSDGARLAYLALARAANLPTDTGSFERRCQAVLRAAAVRRTLFFMAGNRDFLIGQKFLARAHMQPLPDPTALHFGGQCWLLTHGDALCTDDTRYQHFRAQVRAPEWQAAFLARPLAARQAIAQKMRQASEAEHAGRGYAHIDETLAVQWLHAAGSHTLIHGHTHQPGEYAMGEKDEELRRIVLSDWHLTASVHRLDVLRLDANGWRRVVPG